MSFIAKNPLSLPEIKSTPSTPSGTRGLFPKDDGWYEVDSQNNMKKLATNDDIADVAKKAIEISEVELDEVMTEDNNPVFYKVVSETPSSEGGYGISDEFVPYYVYAGVIHPVEGISGFVLYQYKLTPDGLFCRTGSYIPMMLPAFEWTDWQKIGEGGSDGAVSSVNGHTGKVNLEIGDICDNLRITDSEFTYTSTNAILSILPSGSLVWDTSDDNVDADIMLVRYNGETHHLSRKANKDLSNVDNDVFLAKLNKVLPNGDEVSY